MWDLQLVPRAAWSLVPLQRTLVHVEESEMKPPTLQLADSFSSIGASEASAVSCRKLGALAS